MPSKPRNELDPQPFAECIGGPQDGESLIVEPASTISCVDAKGQHVGVYHLDSNAVPPVYRWERFEDGMFVVPLAVALAFVTGRRVDPDEYINAFEALFAELSDGLDTDTPESMVEIRRRAAAAFPIIAGETGCELDDRPCRCFRTSPQQGYSCIAAWVAARVRLYGPTIAVREWRRA